MPTAPAPTPARSRTIVLGDKDARLVRQRRRSWTRRRCWPTEDRGDTLHQQLDTLDSIWSFDITKSSGDINADAKRMVALGRDPEAIAAPAENNEPTGIFVSDGDTGKHDLLGTDDPSEEPGVRIFFTQQHGLNKTYEIVGARRDKHDRDHDGQDGRDDGDSGR